MMKKTIVLSVATWLLSSIAPAEAVNITLVNNVVPNFSITQYCPETSITAGIVSRHGGGEATVSIFYKRPRTFELYKEMADSRGTEFLGPTFWSKDGSGYCHGFVAEIHVADPNCTKGRAFKKGDKFVVNGNSSCNESTKMCTVNITSCTLNHA